MAGRERPETMAELERGAPTRLADLRVAPHLWLTRPTWESVYPDEARAKPSDWQKVVGGMTRVQKLVHLTARWIGDDQAALSKRLFDQGRETYKQGLQSELNKWGCPTVKAVAPAVGSELSAVRERADWAAESVTNTYNLKMAQRIVEIGVEAPKANRHVYAYQLFHGTGWDADYWTAKSQQVAEIESMTMVNAATADFYARNGDIVQGDAFILPTAAVCDICKELVDRSPFRSADEVYRQYDLPVHVNCPHFVDVRAKRLTQQECRMLWAGV